MKNKRTFLFRAGTILLLLLIAGVMMVIGRGHTVYFDNKAIEYNGQTYETPYRIDVYVDGERVARLRDDERGMATNIGQKMDIMLTITQEKGGSEASYNVTFALPYNMDGVAINLPGYMAGLPEEAYLSEFVPAPDPTEEETESGDELSTDEFTGLGDI
ncbi:DUF6672 family protein [Clostridium sp. AN503]|uniref:DUF6672 family protein n=1 Tax=Clostridium sp. AN503 TaxID=3160598 RepID=UPI00345753C1